MKINFKSKKFWIIFIILILVIGFLCGNQMFIAFDKHGVIGLFSWIITFVILVSIIRFVSKAIDWIIKNNTL